MTEQLTVVRRLRIEGDVVRRIGIMLETASFAGAPGEPIPAGWHFPLIGCETAKDALRKDGFPGIGVPMPELGLPRTLAAGRTVRFNRPLLFDAEVVRKSTLVSITHKQGANGPFAVVKVSHELTEAGAQVDQSPAIYEEQTYVLLASAHANNDLPPPPPEPLGTAVRTITPDDTMLFQFSALSFNSHKIHLDRNYARDVEGYPDLVVNGGLVTLIMTEIARLEFGLPIRSLALRNKLPLFCNRPISFFAARTAEGLKIDAVDCDGHLAAEMEVITNEL